MATTTTIVARTTVTARRLLLAATRTTADLGSIQAQGNRWHATVAMILLPPFLTLSYKLGGNPWIQLRMAENLWNIRNYGGVFAFGLSSKQGEEHVQKLVLLYIISGSSTW